MSTRIPTLEELKARGNLPRHVAIIMDGNGRWAKARGVPRLLGHRAGRESVREAVRGWFKPAPSVPNFLAEYSRLGGTHHLAVSYTRDTKPIETFGKLMGWDVVVIA